MKCSICKGRGHIEQSCGTKKNLDRYAKTLPALERDLWASLKYELYYKDWLKCEHQTGKKK